MREAPEERVIELEAVPSVTMAPRLETVPPKVRLPAPVLVRLKPPPEMVPPRLRVLPLAADHVWFEARVTAVLMVRLPVDVMLPEEVRVKPPPLTV